MVQERVQLEHSSHIVKGGVEAACLHFNRWHLLKQMKLTGSFGTMLQDPWHPGKDVKPDWSIQVNCREVHTHACYETTRTCKNFNNQGTKVILLSDKLGSIALQMGVSQ